MLKFKYNLGITLCALLSGTVAQAACPAAPNDLVVWSDFGDTGRHGVYTQGIWSIWYTPSMTSQKEVKTVADRLDRVRCESLTKYGMQDPPNLTQGVFTNVYLHDPESEDGFEDDWGNGVGSGDDDLPYMTIPLGAHLDMSNLDHEGFHIFQFSANAPGFAYEGDSGWFIEATANWFAVEQNPNDETAYLTAGAIASMPHLAMWHGFDNAEPGDPVHWMTETRQYGLQLFLNHLTDTTGLKKEVITSGFFEGTRITPQAYIAASIGHAPMAEAWANFAALMTASFVDHGQTLPPQWALSRDQRDAALDEWRYIVEEEAVPGINHGITMSIDLQTQSGQSMTPPKHLAPRPWAYNVVALENIQGTPRISLQADVDFHMRLVTLTDQTWSYSTVEESDPTDLTQVDVAYLVIAYAPDTYTGSQKQPYRLRLD